MIESLIHATRRNAAGVSTLDDQARDSGNKTSARRRLGFGPKISLTPEAKRISFAKRADPGGLTMRLISSRSHKHAALALLTSTMLCASGAAFAQDPPPATGSAEDQAD